MLSTNFGHTLNGTCFISQFPFNKYITFRCSMQLLDHLPPDTIKYILSIMIDTDHIQLRLLIAEMVHSIFNIQMLNIPKFHKLSHEEVHEAMIFKIVYIILVRLNNDKFDQPYQKIINDSCIICKDINCFSVNNVPLCSNCNRKMSSQYASEVIKFYLGNIINCNFKKNKHSGFRIDPSLHTNHYTLLEKLIPLTYYNYLEYNKGQLVYISKEIQEEIENLERENEILKQSINKNMKIIKGAVHLCDPNDDGNGLVFKMYIYSNMRNKINDPMEKTIQCMLDNRRKNNNYIKSMAKNTNEFAIHMEAITKEKRKLNLENSAIEQFINNQFKIINNIPIYCNRAYRYYLRNYANRLHKIFLQTIKCDFYFLQRVENNLQCTNITLKKIGIKTIKIIREFIITPDAIDNEIIRKIINKNRIHELSTLKFYHQLYIL